MGDCANRTKARQILGYTGSTPSTSNEFVTKEQCITMSADITPLSKYKSNKEIVAVEDIKKKATINKAVNIVDVYPSNCFAENIPFLMLIRNSIPSMISARIYTSMIPNIDGLFILYTDDIIDDYAVVESTHINNVTVAGNEIQVEYSGDAYEGDTICTIRLQYGTDYIVMLTLINTYG